MNSTGTGSARRGPMRITLAAGTALGAGLILLLAAGCSSGGPSTASSSSAGSAASVHSAAGSAARPAPRAPGSFSQAGARAAGPSTQLTVSAPSIIYTARLTIRAHDVTCAAARAAALAAGAGGYVAAEHAVSGQGRQHLPAVTITLKIPVAGYQAALTRLTQLGRLVSLDRQATDVTQQVADVASRVTSQQAAIAQLRVLLRRAGSVSALLGVQDQISADETGLESLLAQQRALSHETSYATVSMQLLSRHRARVHHARPSHRGFLAGLSSGWHAFRTAVSWLLTALGAALPFLILAAILAALGYAGRGRIRRLLHRPTAT